MDQPGNTPRLRFDAQDFELVQLVNEFLAGGARKKPEQLRKLFDPYLHPRGIKELAASQQRRIAYAVIRLLDSLEMGDAADRLAALRCLRDEVLHGSSTSAPRNTARALLEIMKHLVRERGNFWSQVRLAHDFFATIGGRPSVIRKALRKYHLLEMSEEWNQVAFDHHVHDANTKGRKAPTHLIMDAWIKGIRELTVVYYNYMTREALSELTEAAQIMGITVRAAVEVAARFRGKYVQFFWGPRGFSSAEDFLDFLDEPNVRAFFDQGREVAALQKRAVLGLLTCFNDKHLPAFNQRYQIALAPIVEAEFLEYVGVGQPSVAHLADFIHHKCLPRLEERVERLRTLWPSASAEERARLDAELGELNSLLPEQIIDVYLQWAQNPELVSAKVPTEGEDVPALLKLTPAEVLAQLTTLRSGSRITLNCSNLNAADVLELLYIARGVITHVEVFNLKDYKRKKNPHTGQIAEVVRVLNSNNPIAVKRLIESQLLEVGKEGSDAAAERATELERILADIQGILRIYRDSPLKVRLGSDSIGRSRALFGMGLAVLSTLPRSAQREFRRRPAAREVIPVRTEALLCSTWHPRRSDIAFNDLLLRLARNVPGLPALGYRQRQSFQVQENSTQLSPQGNIITLGGLEEHPSNHLSLAPKKNGNGVPSPFNLRYANSSFKSLLKVALGFIPAFLTFALTKDWWLLAYFGAVIWFAITGLRNIIQSVVGGGGIIRSSLLTWNDLVSWQRVADSLLYTGFSVPLLDWLVKGVLLHRGLGVTTANAPLILYSAMALANGVYLFTHNTLRGLPRAAAFGNFFRSVLSIPLALAMNFAIFRLMRVSGMDAGEAHAALQKWAAVIGKAASDTVAGFIEGAVDRSVNMRTRVLDYQNKIAQLLHLHGRLEALFPTRDIVALLDTPKEFFRLLAGAAPDLKRHQIINVLDMMYFWMYKPRAQLVFRRLLWARSKEEQTIILRTMRLLERQRRISEMFLDNLVGKNFSPPLAFYLDRAPAYLAAMARLAQTSAALPATPVDYLDLSDENTLQP